MKLTRPLRSMVYFIFLLAITIFTMSLIFTPIGIAKNGDDIQRVLRNNITNSLKKTVQKTNQSLKVNRIVYSVKSTKHRIYIHDVIDLSPETNGANQYSQFFVASMTKTMIATLILQLTERGNISLDSTLSDTQLFSNKVIKNLHRMGGHSYGTTITIRQLLNHTSGLKDYLIDGVESIGSDSSSGVSEDSLVGEWQVDMPKQVSCVYKDKNCDIDRFVSSKLWNAWDPIAYKKNDLNKDAGMLNYFLVIMSSNALSIPGTKRHYSDTNYLILGLLLEKIYKKSLSLILRENLFDPLNMNCSYLSYRSKAKNGEDCTGVNDINIMGQFLFKSKLNISWDWGGGGVISNSNDLTIFMSSLMEGKLFELDSTLTSMKEIVATATDAKGVSRGYGLGLGWTRDSIAGKAWGHYGAWGSSMFYFPKEKWIIIISVSQYAADNELRMIQEIILDKLAKFN